VQHVFSEDIKEIPEISWQVYHGIISSASSSGSQDKESCLMSATLVVLRNTTTGVYLRYLTFWVDD
jgi:hypothetical protein